MADLRLRSTEPNDRAERIVQSRVEISLKIETEHATALADKLSYSQYQLTQKAEYLDLALQREL